MEPVNVVSALDQIRKSIYSRLLAWARGERLDEDITLYSWQVVRRFLRSKCNAPGDDRAEGDAYTGAKGWNCGLGQMLDLNKEIICKTLPYILTAYMYNYNLPKKAFVRRFAEEKEAFMEEDAFFGIKPHKTKKKKLPGIEKLLSGQYQVEGGSETDVLGRLANLFTFSEVAAYGSTSVTEGVRIKVIGDFDRLYVIPEDYGHIKNMAAARQHITYTQTEAYSPLPPIGEDGFVYGHSRTMPSIERAIDGLGHDLVDFREKMESAEQEQKKELGEYFLQLSHTFAAIKDAYGELEGEIDGMEDALRETAKEFGLKEYIYTKESPSEARPKFSGGMSYDAILNIFATWYHLWTEAQSAHSSGWPGYEVDPVLCVLLLKKTLPSKDTAPYICFENALEQMDEEEARRFVDSLIEAQYNAIDEPEEILPIRPRRSFGEFMKLYPGSSFRFGYG